MRRWFSESQNDSLIYHFSQIIQVNDRTLSGSLYRVDNKDIALALLDSSGEQNLKILKNVSKKRAIMIQEDIEFYGMTYTISECNAAQEKIINEINDTILGISPQNKTQKNMRIRPYTGWYYTGYVPDHSHKTPEVDRKHTRSVWTWVRWFFWLILILTFLCVLIIWDKQSGKVWDKASKANWPTHKSTTPK